MRICKLFLFCAIAIPGACQSDLEDNIVLVNSGNYDKGKIAKLISVINEFSPKVISLDIAFPEYTGDADDKSLYVALRDVKKLVLPSAISYQGQDYQGREIVSVHLTCAAEFFVRYAETGFVSAKAERDKNHIPSQFIVWQKVNYSEFIYHHFSVVTAMAFDSLRASSFIQSHERLVDIDYKDEKRKFKTFSASDVLKGKLTDEDIEGKIVMMGFLGPGNTDKFVSSLNNNQNKPDIYGLEYLANIVAQILEHNSE